MPTALRLDDEITDAARHEAELSQPSLIQQVEYWARLGGAMERMPGVSSACIRAALSARADCDALSAHERQIVLGALETLTFNPGGDRGFRGDAKTGGTPVVTLDDAGQVDVDDDAETAADAATRSAS